MRKLAKFTSISVVIAFVVSFFSVVPANAATNYALGEVSCGAYAGNGVWSYVTTVTLSPGDTFTFRPDSGCFAGNGSSYSDIEWTGDSPPGATVSSTYINGANQMLYNYNPPSTFYEWGVLASAPFGIVNKYINLCNNCGAGRSFIVKIVDPASLIPRGVTNESAIVPYVAPISVSGISVKGSAGCAGQHVSVEGDGFANSTVSVGGKPVKVINNTDAAIEFECPDLAAGNHAIVINNSRGKLTFVDAIRVSEQALRFEAVVETIRNSSNGSLTAAAKTSIKKLLLTNSKAKEVTCTSSSSNAKASKAACAYAKYLKPGLIISTRVLKVAALNIEILFE